MRWTWVVVIALAACGRSHFDDAAVPDTPSGLADFDTDGFPDATDNCPAQLNANQADADGDGIGDACDPHPGAGGDEMIGRGLFSEDFGDWVPDDLANWSLQPGRALTTGDSDSTQARLAIVHGVAHPTIEVSFFVTDYGPMPNNALVLSVAFPDGTWDCTAYGSAGDIKTAEIHKDTISQTSSPLPIGVPAGTSVTMRFTRSENDVTCNLTGTSATFGAVPGMGNPQTMTISVIGMKASIAYAMLYD